MDTHLVVVLSGGDKWALLGGLDECADLAAAWNLEAINQGSRPLPIRYTPQVEARAVLARSFSHPAE